MKAWYVLLLLPFAALIVPAAYARAEPSLAGIPFFYWYQLSWIPASAVLTAIVYLKTR